MKLLVYEPIIDRARWFFVEFWSRSDCVITYDVDRACDTLEQTHYDLVFIGNSIDYDKLLNALSKFKGLIILHNEYMADRLPDLPNIRMIPLPYGSFTYNDIDTMLKEYQRNHG